MTTAAPPRAPMTPAAQPDPAGGPEAVWRQALAEGRFLLQRSASSGRVVFPPRLMTPGDGSDDLDWVEASGMGTVYSVSVIPQKPPADPYHVAIIALDDGVKMMGRVEGVAANDVAIGMRVRARIGAEGDPPQPIVLWQPVGR